MDVTAAARKPKHVSKTKQELRRLRAFAQGIAGLSGREHEFESSYIGVLAKLATAALTGKRPEAA